MRIILFLIGLALSLDGLYCGAVGAMTLGEAMVTGIGIAFILWSVFYDAFRKKKFLRFLKGLFMTCIVILLIYSAGICVFGNINTVTYDEDYVIVLGAGIKDTEPSLTLQRRLDKTIEYMNRNKKAVAIVSGGKGYGESIPESQAMKAYLVNRGIEEERIIEDENATSTYENFVYSKMAADSGKIAFITSDFHVLRSWQMAKVNGIEATHMGASTPISTLPVVCAREFVAQIATIRYY